MFFNIYLSLMILVHNYNVNDDLVKTVLDFHKETRSQYQMTYSEVDFQIKFTDQSLAPQKSSGKFWITPEMVRCFIDDSGKAIDILTKAQVQTSIVRTSQGGRNLVSTSRNAQPYSHNKRCDAWLRALFVINVPGTAYGVEFEQLVSMADKVEGKRVIIDANEFVVIKLKYYDKTDKNKREWNVEAFFDPNLNYLIREVKYSSYNSSRIYVERNEKVEEYASYSGGLLFPRRCSGAYKQDGKTLNTSVTTFSNTVINQKIPSSIGVQTFPHGVMLTDVISNISYPVNSRGEKIGPPKALQKRSAILRASSGEEELVKFNYTKLIFWIALLCLIICLVIICIKRFRFKSDG